MNARCLAMVSGALLWLAILPGPARGQTSFEECEAWLDEEPESEAAAECFYRVDQNLGEHEEAMRFLEQGIQRYPDSPWLRFFLGNVWMLAERCPKDAQEAFREAAQKFSDGKNSEGQSRALTSLAWSLAICRKFEESRAELENAARVASQSEDLVTRMRFDLVRLTIEMRSGGDLEVVYQQLQTLWEMMGQPSFEDDSTIGDLRRECAAALGHASITLRRFKKATKWYREARDHAREAGRLRDEARFGYNWILYQIVYALPSDTKRTEIIDSLWDLLPAAEDSGHLEVEARIRLQLARIKGGPEAEAHLERCQQLAEEQENVTLRRRCALAQASHCLKDDPDSDRGRARARRLLSKADSTGPHSSEDPWLKMSGWDDRIRIVWETQSQEALASAEQTLVDIEALRSTQTGMARIQILDALSEAYYWLSGSLLNDRAEEEENVRRAFAVMERLRAQELREVLLLEGMAATSLSSPPLDLLDEVQHHLSEGEAMLSYQLAPERDIFGRFAGDTWVTVVTRDSVSVHKLEVDRVVVEPVVEALIWQADEQLNDQSLANFHQVLLQPVLSQLPSDIHQLVLIPDGVLHLLPFAALRSDADAAPLQRAASSARALAQRYEISIQPSAALWLSWKQSENPSTEASALVLVDPKPSSDAESVTHVEGPKPQWRGDPLGPLPYARREGKKVIRHVRGASRMLRGSAASESYLKQANLHPFRLLHFATHAEADTERPWLSGLLLADGEGEDGWLSPEEIANLELDGKAIVLSTCNSASGGWLRGEGVMSLGRAFFQAGAHAVVGTLRPLPDKDGAKFFDDYYRYLSRGLSLRQALAETQREWAEADEPASVWASIVVMGNGDLVPIPGGVERSWLPWHWVTLGLSVLFLVGLIWFLYRRRRGL